ncbi:hypothetical protein [Reichenbachiella sp. MSK19-1]|uniref:hypothetical protein n=1 Tax=Reichenbachiella sp. MSK19-1 TaxID=1897631 RepID=UPI000E6D55F5|nr:hypothetical protein [Reichenbachiella sp. MSK19-1]RJE75218.1 hypothetical protein BGP76_19145 [Reichenbachiella sp. MSK19-1]
MTEETKEYIANYNLKFSEIKKDDLASLFEKFNTLYPMFNRLYNDALREEAINDQKLKGFGDYKRATFFVRDYVGAENIIDNLKKDKQIKSVIEIADLINKKVFHINLQDGKGQEKTDIELATNLLSEDAEIKSKAILGLVYNVRCNIVHGHKDFQEYQRLLMEPIIGILRTIVNTLENRMK